MSAPVAEEILARPAPVPFHVACAYWLRLGFISFGGPAGQIAVVLATAGLLAAGRRLLPPAMPAALRLASYAIGITSAYWLIDRMIMA